MAYDLNDPQAAGFMEAVFHSAEMNAALLGLPDDDPRIAAEVERADFVYALWREPSNASGWGILSVKDLAPSTDDSKFVIGKTIPCVDGDAARQLQLRFGGTPS